MTAVDRDPGTFFFLFRTDKGRVDRATWWRGTVPIAVLAGVGAMGWTLLRPYAHHDLATQAFIEPMTLVAYLYLVLFAFAVILLAICEYNLSAKRFRDRRRPAALASVLPLSLLFGGAALWYVPNSSGDLPDWTVPLVLAAIALVAVWNVVELGVLRDRAAA